MKNKIEQIIKDNGLDFITDKYADYSEIESFWNAIVDGLNLDFCVDYVQRDCDGWVQSTYYCKKLEMNIIIDNDFPVVVENVEDVIVLVKRMNKLIKNVEAKIN